MGSNSKICNKCKQDLPSEAFSEDKSRPDGRKSWCRSCVARRYHFKKLEEGWLDNRNKVVASLRKRKKAEDPHLQWAKDALRNAKRRSRHKNLEFTLVLDDVLELLAPFCPLLGVVLNYGSTKLSDDSPTLDRLDSSLGYTKKNILVVSHRANRIKSDSTLDELQLLIKNLLRYTNSA